VTNGKESLSDCSWEPKNYNKRETLVTLMRTCSQERGPRGLLVTLARDYSKLLRGPENCSKREALEDSTYSKPITRGLQPKDPLNKPQTQKSATIMRK
jgi:hypothetical protein